MSQHEFHPMMRLAFQEWPELEVFATRDATSNQVIAWVREYTEQEDLYKSKGTSLAAYCRTRAIDAGLIKLEPDALKK